jgi:hypothetical protein
MGEQNYVLKEMKDYWGGMLNEGATSFWEEYNPNKKGKEHLEMYGRPYGKSLCHAWGASPIYLLGKYYLGVKPTAPGYSDYSVEPVLGGLKWMKGEVPTPNGKVKVDCSLTQIKVLASEGKGTLKIKSAKTPKVNYGKVTKLDNNLYEVKINPEQELVVSYKAM